MFLEILKLTLFMMISFIGLFIVFGFIYEKIENKSVEYIQRTLGYNGILLTGIGTVVHELSHYVMCLVFDHKITRAKLFRPIEGKKDGVLGYVEHSYNKNSLYQRIGNFFIGIAPMIIGTLVICIAFRVLLPNIYSNLNISSINSAELFKILGENLNIVLKAIFELENLKDINFWIFIYLLTSISMHMSLSKADMRNSKSGLVAIFVLIMSM